MFSERDEIYFLALKGKEEANALIADGYTLEVERIAQEKEIKAVEAKAKAWEMARNLKDRIKDHILVYKQVQTAIRYAAEQGKMSLHLNCCPESRAIFVENRMKSAGFEVKRNMIWITMKWGDGLQAVPAVDALWEYLGAFSDVLDVSNVLVLGQRREAHRDVYKVIADMIKLTLARRYFILEAKRYPKLTQNDIKQFDLAFERVKATIRGGMGRTSCIAIFCNTELSQDYDPFERIGWVTFPDILELRLILSGYIVRRDSNFKVYWRRQPIRFE